MAARIIHFGEDVGGRVQVFAEVGYAIDSCGTSVAKLSESLSQGADAVTIEEDGAPGELDVVSIVRSYEWVPLILFKGVDKKFDPLQV